VNPAGLTTVLAVAGVLVALAVAVLAVVSLRARRPITTPAQRATYEVLHTASLAGPALRAGLSEVTAAKAVRPLHALLGSLSVGLLDHERVLAWEGPGDHHGEQVLAAAEEAAEAGRPVDLRVTKLDCGELECQVRGGVVVPLATTDGVVGALVALTGSEPAPGLVRAAIETGNWVATQLSLAELDASRDRLAQAQVRALRAQISPHFIYNALSAISSLVRTDPERARELILEFAEFTRYSFRAHGEFTTLAEELRSIDRYLLIERARFGERLQVRLQVAPEVLPVAVPFLCLQPLVENAVRHGLADKPGVGTISIVARDAGAECLISVEDDGVGMDPELVARRDDGGDHVGLGNVDDRLRSVFGDDFGLVVETAPGAGTKVIMRVPKFHPGVRAASGWAS
jgi:two-component system, LytTR family, sensor kinase